MARYGQGFKDRAVARLLPPESAAVAVVSGEIGVSVATLERWRADALSLPDGKRIWTATARLEAVGIYWGSPTELTSRDSLARAASDPAVK